MARGKAGRIMAIIFISLAACMAVLAVVLLAYSPGRPRPILDEDGNAVAGSISEKIKVNINGFEQGMFITGRDAANPVLLFLHGGPGMPEYFLTKRYPTGLENLFTVCWWERRGAGLSYRADIPPETMTMEQMIADTLAVTDYLRDRFGKQKIYLMGHSGGSFIAIQAAARSPERYHAYIGMSQMSYQLESERLAYDYLLGWFSDAGDTATVRKLRNLPVTMTVPLPMAWMRMRDGVMHRAGVGTTRDMKSVITGVFFPSWFSRDYTLKEKAAIWVGKKFAQSLMWDPMFATDLRTVVKRLDLPVYFFHGKYDYTVSYALMKSWFAQLEAPLKGFYTFEGSAHSPVFEEPEAMGRIFREDVLRATNGLADR